MKPEEQRVAIAKACGWTEITFTGTSYQGIRPQSAKRYCNWNRPAPSPNVDDTREWHWLPDYTNSLDAMNEAITQHGNSPQWMEFRSEFTRNLLEVVRRGPNYLDGTAAWYFATATPMQLAEAFLKTLNLWKE